MKKFHDLLIFAKKRLQTIALQRIEAGMGFVISRSLIVAKGSDKEVHKKVHKLV